MGFIAVMLPPDGACENALPRGTNVLIEITNSNADAETIVASLKFTFIKILEAARVIMVISKKTTFGHG